MTTADAYQELLHRWREAALLDSCAAVLNWDERTYMPAAGAKLRSSQLAILKRLTHEMTTAPRIGELLAILEGADLDETAIANVREIRRSYQRAVKIPSDVVEELASLSIQAPQVWEVARRDNDYALFQPWLERFIVLKRREAEAIGYRDHPYEALLDEYEPGMTVAELRRIFAGLAAELVPLLEAIKNTGRRPRRDILHRNYPVADQQAFAMEAASAIGFDFNAGRLDTTAHPFCSGIGPGDCRITTRYNPSSFAEAFFGVLHEAGHGLYDQGLPSADFGAPAGTFCSLGIHESQSRLWENQVGRSRSFWQFFFPKAQRQFPDALADVSAEEFYFAINEVRPSFIRVEADEATYNLHIILRFELELDLLTGNLAPADLPGAWNERFRALLGLVPPDDRRGCLQDIHWSLGSFGYFPTYTLGNLYAAQLMQTAQLQLQGLDSDFAAGRFHRLKNWLRIQVHQQGRRYRSEELCRRITGQSLSQTAFVEYLRHKLGELYGL